MVISGKGNRHSKPLQSFHQSTLVKTCGTGLQSFVLQEETNWENVGGKTQFFQTILGNIPNLLSEGSDPAIYSTDYPSRMVNGLIHSFPSVGDE